jgi:alpha-ketoglutarate-dependent taurine dioxygenase
MALEPESRRPAKSLPLALDGCGVVPLEVAASELRGSIQDQLDHFGAILLSNCLDVSPVSFGQFARTIAGDPLEYLYRSTPRESVGQGVYTASEYPANRSIPMHNENAYQRDWPMRVFFCCIQAATLGGETPLASTLGVTRRIPPIIGDRFERKEIMYVRNYSPGVDLPWQVVFQTESSADVEDYCKRNDIHYEWRPNGALRTKQVRPAFARHPRSGDLVWFNQAHLFHISSLNPESREALLEVYREEDLPRHAYFGDGTEIADGELDEIRDAFLSETVTFPWHTGDVLLLDNMLVSHGRMPYRGVRKLLTALGEPYSSAVGR